MRWTCGWTRLRRSTSMTSSTCWSFPRVPTVLAPGSLRSAVQSTQTVNCAWITQAPAKYNWKSRLTPKIGGLFSPSITMETYDMEKLTGPALTCESPTLVTCDLADLLCDLDATSYIDLHTGQDNCDLDLHTAGSSTFHDVFTDLTQLLQLETMVPGPATDALFTQDPISNEIPEASVANENTSFETVSTPQGRPARKRKASEVSAVGAVPSDHSDYIMKSRRVSDSSDSAHDGDRYRQRRNKNNVASKRSREVRKMKYRDMESEATVLERTNAELRQRIAHMETLVAEMKQTLIERLSR